MKFIVNEKMQNEKLEWGELIGPNEHADFWHHEIVDSSGEVHIGVIYEDGAVETAYAVWDSVDTIERFEARPIVHSYRGRETRTLHWNREANELFCELSHRNTCNTYIYRLKGSELLDWFLAASEHDVIEAAQHRARHHKSAGGAESRRSNRSPRRKTCPSRTGQSAGFSRLLTTNDLAPVSPRRPNAGDDSKKFSKR